MSKSLTVRSVLERAAARWPRRMFVYEQGEQGFEGHCFSKLVEDAQALAAALCGRGLRGKNILLLGENSYPWMVADLAIMAYTGVCVAVNCAWPADEVLQAVHFTDAAAVFCSAAQRPAVEPLCGQLPMWVLEDDLPALLQEGKRALAAGSVHFDEYSPDQVVKIIFSSGTTGLPKAAMLTQRNLFAGLDSLERRAPMDDDDRCYLLLPLYHTYGGIYNFLYMLYIGARVYLSSGAKSMVEEMQQVKPTVFCGVPKIFAGLLAQVQALPNAKMALCGLFGGQIRYLFCGGSSSDPVTRRFYKQAELCLLEAYALTETASSFSIEYPGDEDCESVGTLFEEIEVRIGQADADGWGEVLVRGDNVFAGYYKNTAATRDAFTADYFFHTGDIGRVDAKRRLYLKGRCRPMFKTSCGERVRCLKKMAK